MVFNKKHAVNDIKQSITNNNEGVFLPSKNNELTNHDTNSWFSISKTDNIHWVNKTKIEENKSFYTRTYLLKPTHSQRRKLKHMINETTKIYNIALKHIKHDKLYKKNLSFITIRNSLKNQKSTIKNQTPTHVLDLSIKKAVTNYKSAVSNFKNRNIKNFRIRYYKLNKNIDKNLYFEPCYVRKNGSISKLGFLNLYDVETKKNYKLEKKNVHHEFTISCVKNKYYLRLTHSNITEEHIRKRQEFISLDPGINPFLAGVADNNSYLIGENNCEEIRKINQKMDRIDSMDIKNKIKKNNLERLRRKLKNKITDLHWKTINFLTKNFDNILIGDMSSKDCIRKKGNLGKMNKRLLNSFSFYRFKERLKYKCSVKNVNFEEVNEYCTSKTCSRCGYFKKDLGALKVYQCDSCENIMHRDLNAARNIYFVSLI